MPINSRSKGAKNEKKIADILTIWTGKKFARAETNNYIHKRNADNSKGDIVCKTEGHYFPFCIEAKSYAKIDFSHLLIPGIKNVDILDFWAQVKEDATNARKIPLLMMRYNSMPSLFWFIAMEYDYYNQLPIFSRMFCKTTLMFWDREKNIRLMIVKSTEFFKPNYKEIKANAKAYIKKTPKKAIKE